MFAHVHSTGGAYYAHGGVWVELANKTDVAELSEDTTPALGGNLDAAGFNIANAGSITSTGFIGNLTGNVTGSISGRSGSTDKLASATTFRMVGDVSSPEFSFDGQDASVKTFTTSIDNTFIAAKTEQSLSEATDEYMFNRPVGDTGVFKISRTNLFKAIPQLPVGMITAFAAGVLPADWLICDGIEVTIAEYQTSFNVIEEGGKKKLDIDVFFINMKNIDKDIISSSKISDLLIQGKIINANNYLGEKYTLSGKVEKGDQIGRTIGFPTANIKLQEKIQLPSDGIYACYVKLGDKLLLGALSIGNRPTIKNDSSHKIEVFIIDFKENIYDEIIELLIVDKVRAQVEFGSLDDLKNQMKKDIIKIKKILKINFLKMN